MAIVVEKAAKPATLTKAGVQYDFVPVDADTVEIRHKTGRSYLVYAVPRKEARDLWFRLREKGYERF